MPSVEISLETGWAGPAATVIAAFVGTVLGGFITLRLARQRRDEQRHAELVAALGAYLHVADMLADALNDRGDDEDRSLANQPLK